MENAKNGGRMVLVKMGGNVWKSIIQCSDKHIQKAYPGIFILPRQFQIPVFSVQIPDVATSSIPVDISGVEFIPDAYEAILQAEREGLLTIIRYEEMNDKMRAWNKKTILEEYENASDHPSIGIS